MIRFATIGTNWITTKFIDAALQTEKMQLVAVYSRDIDRAKQFAAAYNVTYSDELANLAQTSAIDAIYIASPNVLHAEQSMLFLRNNKHVICEKPATSNLVELEQVLTVAEQQKRVYFEAFKTAYLPNFYQLKQAITQIGKIRKVIFNYCQYSSRYPKYLQGYLSNTFNPDFSGGSIMDIGFYCVASAIALFGEPKHIQAQATLLSSGVDGAGSVILQYQDFDVMISHSKISQSHLESEIQGEEGTIVVDDLANCRSIVIYSNDKEPSKPTDLTQPQRENNLFYEAYHFADLIDNNLIDHEGRIRSYITAKVLTEIRRQTGVVFPADCKRVE